MWPTIATCRRAANGGKFRGSLASQLDILTKAAAAGCQFVDMELQSALALQTAAARTSRAPGPRSSFPTTTFAAPKSSRKPSEKMVALPADFYKIVTTATTLL